MKLMEVKRKIRNDPNTPIIKLIEQEVRNNSSYRDNEITAKLQKYLAQK